MAGEENLFDYLVIIYDSFLDNLGRFVNRAGEDPVFNLKDFLAWFGFQLVSPDCVKSDICHSYICHSRTHGNRFELRLRSKGFIVQSPITPECLAPSFLLKAQPCRMFPSKVIWPPSDQKNSKKNWGAIGPFHLKWSSNLGMMIWGAIIKLPKEVTKFLLFIKKYQVCDCVHEDVSRPVSFFLLLSIVVFWV